MIDVLKKNIETEIGILREISYYYGRLDESQVSERKLLVGVIRSLQNKIKIVNGAIPRILNDFGVSKKLSNNAAKKIVKKEIKGVKVSKGGEVYVKEEDRSRFLKELNISEDLVSKITKKKKVEKSEFAEFKAARGYLKLSNRFFLDNATKLINKGKFKSLSVDIKKSNFDMLFGTYISMMFFTTLLSSFLAIILWIVLTFIDFSFVNPLVQFYSSGYFLRFLKLIWIPLAIPVLTYFSIYFYPATEKRSLEKRIDQELPFAVIHMSAISESGIAPSEIFKIIALSKEYVYLRKEVRKILNQINLYGYDLGTALSNAAKGSPSNKLAELFSGLATTVSSGGSLSEFFEKRSQTLLLSYRLEREKFTKNAETFMDIYISVVLATPMILMLLLVIISISGIQIGLSPGQMGILVIFIIALVNVIFLAFIHLKQPVY